MQRKILLAAGTVLLVMAGVVAMVVIDKSEQCSGVRTVESALDSRVSDVDPSKDEEDGVKRETCAYRLVDENGTVTIDVYTHPNEQGARSQIDALRERGLPAYDVLQHSGFEAQGNEHALARDIPDNAGSKFPGTQIVEVGYPTDQRACVANLTRPRQQPLSTAEATELLEALRYLVQNTCK